MIENIENNVVFLFKHMNWNEHATGEWESTKWEIYDDLTVKISLSYRLAEEKNKKYSVSIDKEDYKSIVEMLKIIKENNITVDAYDGSAWEITQYENGNEIWKREAGYIYGIKELQEIADFLNNLIDYRLYRKDLIEFINNKFNYRKDDISKLTVSILNEIYSELLKYKYKFDDRFYTYGRRDFLQKEIEFYLDKNQLVDAFVNFYQYAEANTWIDLAAIPENLNVQEVLDNDYKYKDDGIICEQEKNKIIEMIKALKDGLEGKELSAVSDNNKKDNIYGKEKEREIKLDDGTVIGREYYVDSNNDVEESKAVESLDELSKIFDDLFPSDESADSKGEK